MEPTSHEGKEGENLDVRDRAKDKEKPYWKAVRIAAAIGITEAFSLVFWIKSEDFKSETAFYIRWLAGCGFLAGGAYLAHKLVFGEFRRRKICAVWITWSAICVILLCLKSKIPPSPEPAKPHMQLAVIASDSTRIFKMAGKTLSEQYLCFQTDSVPVDQIIGVIVM